MTNVASAPAASSAKPPPKPSRNESEASFETRAFHHALEAFLVGVHPNGFGEIAIAVGVVHDKLAEPGQNLKRIDVVEGRERPPHPRKFEHQQRPAGPQHSTHFRERGILMRHVA